MPPRIEMLDAWSSYESKRARSFFSQSEGVIVSYIFGVVTPKKLSDEATQLSHRIVHRLLQVPHRQYTDMPSSADRVCFCSTRISVELHRRQRSEAEASPRDLMLSYFS